jgi:CMP-N,N'-diacetyllegionaminic acid synthase
MGLLAFIPARAGSKSIPHKNITLINGKPLVQYTMEAALQSSGIDSIFVSTDDPAVVQIANGLGIEVPYQRPQRLAQDDTPMVDTVLHGLEWLRTNCGNRPEAVMLLQPTSPLRNADDIQGAINQFQKTDADSLVSVHEMNEHPYECIRDKGRSWTYLAKSDVPSYRRQDYKKTFYYINGAMYLCRVAFLELKKTLIQEGETAVYIMPAERGIDVDTDYDLLRCEQFLEYDDNR